MSTKKKIGLINPKRESLTPDKLRELSGLQLTDEEAEETIESLKKLAFIMYEATKQKEQETQKKIETGDT